MGSSDSRKKSQKSSLREDNQRNSSELEDITSGPNDETTPLPWCILIWSTLTFFVAMMGRQVARPFLPFFVQSFFEGLEEKDIGYYLGIVFSLLDVGALAGSCAYGIIADRFGRRPVLLIGVMGSVILLPVFGFSLNYAMAAVVITLWGGFAANLPIARTTVHETTDDTNRSTAFAIFMTVPGLCRTTAPLIGGYLANPADHFKIFENSSLFITFPYILPLFVAGCIALVTFIGIYMVVPETAEHIQGCSPTTPAKESFEDMDVPLPAAGEGSGDAKGKDEKERLLQVSGDDEVGEAATWMEIFSDRLIITTTFVYVINGFCLNVVHTSFPMWVILDYAHGGFDMGPKEMGLVLALIGPLEFFYQATFPFLTKRFSFRTLLLSGTFLMTVFCILFPMTGLINTMNYNFVAFCIIAVYLGIVCMRLTIQTSIFVVLGNVSTNRNRGRVNGMSDMLMTGTRIVGPLFSGFLFAWSVNVNGLYPFNWFFVFHILALLNFLSFTMCLFLPKELSVKVKPIPKKSTTQ